MVKSWQSELGVVGLQFRWTKDGRQALKRMTAAKDIGGIRLEREPDNKYDPNAIKVLLPNRLMEGKQLGYLSRHVAEVLAPKLDSGSVEVRSAQLTEVSGETDNYETARIVVRFQDTSPAKTRPKRKPAKKV